MAKRSQSWQSLPSPLALVALTATALLVAPVIGQCPLQWLPGPQLSGTDGPVDAVVEWDPDGAGPRTPVIVAGGTFLAAGGVIANHVAAYDPATSTWSNFGTGVNGGVLALAVLPSGDLVAAGSFTTAGGNPANRVARWDGSSWSPLGVGTSGPVRDLTVLLNGDLVAAGTFASAGGATVNNIARWNGFAWASLGSGVNSTVHALTTMPNGDLVAGGEFTTAGGAPANRIARWNGVSWSTFGAGTVTAVRSLIARPNGDVFAGLSNGVVVVQWNGSTWSTLLTGGSPGLPITLAHALAALPNGDVVVAGTGVPVQSWNGATWSLLGSSNTKALTVLANGPLVVGGQIPSIGGVPAENLAFWDGAAWSATTPAPGPVTVNTRLLTLPDGDLVSGGTLSDNLTRVGRWTGNTWLPLGGAFDLTVTTIMVHPSGDILAGGSFTAAGGTAAGRVARWNGTTWSPLGSGTNWTVRALTTLPNGDIVVGGEFSIAGNVPANGVARWNGTNWSPLGTGASSVQALLTLPNGDVLAGRSEPGAEGVTRWNGTTWSPLGTLPASVFALALLPNGDVVAGGRFTQAGGTPLNNIARWDGVAWLPLGSGVGSNSVDFVREITVLPDGDLIVCGSFLIAGGVAVPLVARWDGSSWSAVVNAPTPGFIVTATVPQQGGIAFGGMFASIDGHVSARLARLGPTCPAAATPSGTGCSGSGGLNALAAQSLPWCGSTYRAIATGLPANSLALGAYGATTTAIALPAILPLGAPGCALLVTPDVVEIVLPSAGAAQTQLAIPNTVSLAGLVLHQQIVALDLGTTGSIVSVTSTNRLSLTIGAF